MQALGRTFGRHQLSPRIVALASVTVVLTGMVLLPERDPDVAGGRAILDAALTFALALTVIAVGSAAGRLLAGRMAPAGALDSAERLVLSFAMGMAVIAFGVLGLGLVGLLQTAWIAALLILIAGLCAHGARLLLSDARDTVRSLLDDWKGARVGLALVLGLVISITFVVLMISLAPPWAYDGLMYHLEAPQIFLTQGRVTALPDLLQANGPLLTQMLYTTPVAFGRDAAAQILHAAFAWLLLLAVLTAGRRLITPQGGWLAAGVLLGIPIFPLWGTLAYADMTHALYEFLAVWGILRWRGDRQKAWLVTSALMAALAVGTKLVALYLVPVLCLWLALLAQDRGWSRALRTSVVYGLLTSLFALPWFILNTVHLGDPFYPFLFGGPVWPASRVDLLQDYLQSFGTGRSLTDFLLVPWNLYARHGVFATLMSSIEYPSFLFPLALLVPLISLSPRLRPVVIFCLLRLVAWFAGSQQTRFLLPLFPVLSLMTADVLLGLEHRFRLRLGNVRMLPVLVTGLVVSTLIYASLFAWGSGVFRVVLGSETRDTYLERLVYDYRAMRFIMDRLPPEARVLHLWDGQGYFCDERCLPDSGQVQWTYLHHLGGDLAGVKDLLRAQGITHVLLDLEGLNFILQHDPRGTHLAAAGFFLKTLAPECGEVVYADPKVEVYRLTCLDGNTGLRRTSGGLPGRAQADRAALPIARRAPPGSHRNEEATPANAASR